MSPDPPPRPTGAPAARFPVHVVYGGAPRFRADLPSRMGRMALAALDAYAPTPTEFAAATGLDPALAHAVVTRVRARLAREPVEDFRIDFEDGYGYHGDGVEDADADRAGRELATGAAAGTLPPAIGIRIKPCNDEFAARAARTLERFLRAAAGAGAVPGRDPRVPPFVVTLPKVSSPDEVLRLVEVLARLESGLGAAEGTLGIELMVETPRALLAADGRVAVPGLVAAGAGRVCALHFGPYDYTALLGIGGADQRLDHPACDFARDLLLLAAAPLGLRVSDGPVTTLPVPPHRAPDGGALAPAAAAENRRIVHEAWRLHFVMVTRALSRGYRQGWDLHPHQLPTRYAAVYAHFLAGLDEATTRLARFLDQATRAVVAQGVFDDAATGQGLLNGFVSAVECGAIDEAEAVSRTGLSLEELRGRSFQAIVDRRAGR